MPKQTLDKLKPDSFTVEVDGVHGDREPSSSRKLGVKKKNLRLRKLLWSGEWKDVDFQLIAWNEANQSWYLWEKKVEK